MTTRTSNPAIKLSTQNFERDWLVYNIDEREVIDHSDSFVYLSTRYNAPKFAILHVSCAGSWLSFDYSN